MSAVRVDSFMRIDDPIAILPLDSSADVAPVDIF
jgi:hypothetical protein